MNAPLRILVTGSRSWSNEDVVREAVLDTLATYTTVGPPVTGSADTAIRFSDQRARNYGHRIEESPDAARWTGEAA